MNISLLAYVWRSLLAVPALVSAGLLVTQWWNGQLFGGSGATFCVWFVAAAIAQFFGRTTGIWIAGLLAQVALAILLLVKNQLGPIS